MTDLALPKGSRPPTRTAVGVMMGGWKCYVNPATVALLEVWNVGNAFQVMATLGVTDRDGAPIRRPVSAPCESEDEAGAEMDRLAGSLFACVSPILRPAPDPGPVL